MRKGWLLLSPLLVACAYTRVEPTTIPSPLQPVSATAVLPAASPRTTHGLPLLSQTAPTFPAPTAMLTPTAIPVPISTPTAVTAAPSQAMTVIGQESVNVRESPDLDAAVVAQVEPGDDVLLIGPAVLTADGSSRWVHILSHGTAGYIRDDLVTAAHPAVPASTVVQQSGP